LLGPCCSFQLVIYRAGNNSARPPTGWRRKTSHWLEAFFCIVETPSLIFEL
jgi:hypothetical protein